MLIIPPSKYRKARRPAAQPAAPVLPGPVLVEANVYSQDGLTVGLIFDSAVDFTGLVVEAITVLNGNGDGHRYQGHGSPSYVDETTVVVGLQSVGDYAGSDSLLTVAAGNGIVAVGGGPWAGVSDAVLPFGE